MIQVTPQMRILAAVEPADFRKGIDGLARICREVLHSDPFSGCVFVFCNKSRKAVMAILPKPNHSPPGSCPQRAVAGARSPGCGFTLSTPAAILEGLQRCNEAEPLYRRSIAILERNFGQEHLDVVMNFNNLAALLQAKGDLQEAELLYRQALTIKKKTLGPDHVGVATSLNNLAVFYSAQNRYANAELLYRRSLAILEKAFGPGHSKVQTLLANYQSLQMKEVRRSRNCDFELKNGSRD